MAHRLPFWLIGAIALAALAASPRVASAVADSTRAVPPPVTALYAQMRVPADVVYSHGAGPDSAVVFRHTSHVFYSGHTCTPCHPRPFRILSASGVPGHAAMNGGGSCGICHDGKRAFSTRDKASCATCHTGSRSVVTRAEIAQGPGPIVYRRLATSPGAVTFRHVTHLKPDATCNTCHPRPFVMKAFATAAANGMHSPAACAACHDGARAFAMEDPGNCRSCHVR